MYLNIWKIFRFRDFMGDFREWPKFGSFWLSKKIQLLEYGFVMYSTEASDPEISNLYTLCTIRDGGSAGRTPSPPPRPPPPPIFEGRN